MKNKGQNPLATRFMEDQAVRRQGTGRNGIRVIRKTQGGKEQMTVSNEEKNNISKRLKSACQRVMRLRNVYARFLWGD